MFFHALSIVLLLSFSICTWGQPSVSFYDFGDYITLSAGLRNHFSFIDNNNILTLFAGLNESDKENYKRYEIDLTPLIMIDNYTLSTINNTYNLTVNEYDQIEPTRGYMPRTDGSFGYTQLNDKIYIPYSSKTLLIYDINTRSFVNHTTYEYQIPEGSVGFNAYTAYYCITSNNVDKIYVISSYSGDYASRMQIYDINTNQWSQGSTISKIRRFANCFYSTNDNGIYWYGGDDMDNNYKLENDVFYYDIDNNRWSYYLSAFSKGVKLQSCIINPYNGNNICMAGSKNVGYSGNVFQTAVVNSFDPKSGDLAQNIGAINGDPTNPDLGAMNYISSVLYTVPGTNGNTSIIIINGGEYCYDCCNSFGTTCCSIGCVKFIKRIQYGILRRLPPTPAPTEYPTKNPITSEPTTSNPTTSEPTTSEPTTLNPTTLNPTTSEPTTAIPTTLEPTTWNPTTSEPTTSVPTTTDTTTTDYVSSTKTSAEATTTGSTVTMESTATMTGTTNSATTGNIATSTTIVTGDTTTGSVATTRQTAEIADASTTSSKTTVTVIANTDKIELTDKSESATFNIGLIVYVMVGLISISTQL